jgi:cbb3-type cytochrome oxidase maturation protein
MEIIYLLIPLSIVLVALIIAGFFWAVNSGQFDDLEGPAHRILQDQDELDQQQRPDKKDQQQELDL